jgi:hypothetical protein
LHHHRAAGLLAGLLCLALAAPAAAQAPATVTVRIEGGAATLREAAPLRTFTGTVRGKDGCDGTDLIGALEAATGGDWEGQDFGSDFGVERIFSETHRFSDNRDYWAAWVNHRELQTGVCATPLQEGDDVLFFVARCEFNGSACANDPVYPLGLSAPASGRTDAPSQVTVVKYAPDGTASPIGGARVTGPGVDVTTGAGGTASVTFGQAGQIPLKASMEGAARSAAAVVSVSAPGAAPPPPAPIAVADRQAPVARIAGIRSGARFSRRKAPRRLRGSVAPDPSGLRTVKLSLTRSARGRCQLYSPSKERFRRSRCGRRVNFSIGDRQDWSYLLPHRLRRGRYVLDVIAVDKLGNRDQLARGRNRVVFFVR